MFDLIMYIIPVIVLVIGIIFHFVGSLKKNNKIKGVGIGIIISLIVLESPDFFHGFIDGATKG